MRIASAARVFFVMAFFLSASPGFCAGEVVLRPGLYEFPAFVEPSSKGFLWRFFSTGEAGRGDYDGSLSAFPSGDGVLLIWTSRTWAEGYNVYVSLGGTAVWRFELEASLPHYKTEYPHHGLTGGMRYYYVVTAVDRFGAESPVAPYAAYACPVTGGFGVSEVPFGLLTREEKDENN